MKKIIVLILALAMLVSLVACGGDTDTSKAESKPAVSDTVSEEESEEPAESEAESEPETSEPEPETSEEPIVEPPEEEQEAHVLTGDGDLLNRNSAFVHIADADGHPSNYGTSPLRLNRWNGEIQPGDTVLITGEEGAKVTEVVQGQYAGMQWWNVIVFEYDMSTYRYKVIGNYAAGEEKGEIVLPKDGFAIAIHQLAGSGEEIEATKTTSFKEVNAANVTNGGAYEVGKNVVLVGISALQIHWEATSRSAAPVMDGQIRTGEYGDAVLTFDGTTPELDYRHFAADDKYATGAFYATYDAENLYLAWEIASEHHNNTLDQAGASGMWQYDCMQIIVSAVNPNHSAALDEALGWGGSPSGCGTAGYDWNAEIGIAVNNDGESIQCTWWGDLQGFESKSSRDDTLGKTIYEVKIPLASMNAAFADNQIESLAAGVELGVSFSVNTHDGTTSRVLRLRDGGGIFGSNDFSKLPVLTLK